MEGISEDEIKLFKECAERGDSAAPETVLRLIKALAENERLLDSAEEDLLEMSELGDDLCEAECWIDAVEAERDLYKDLLHALRLSKCCKVKIPKAFYSRIERYGLMLNGQNPSIEIGKRGEMTPVIPFREKLEAEIIEYLTNIFRCPGDWKCGD